MNRKTIVQNFLLYAMTALLYRGINLLLMPLYMRFLSPAQYGVLSLIEGFVYIITTIIGVGLRKLLAIEYVHYAHEDQKKLTNTIIITHLSMAIPILFILYMYRATLLSFVFSNTITPQTFNFVLLMTFCSFFCELLYQIMRFEHKAKILSLIHIFHAVSIASITLCCFFFFNIQFIAIPAAQSVTMALVVLIGTHIWFKSQYAQHLEIKNALRKSGGYIIQSMPLMVGTLLQWVLESSDRWMLARLGCMHDVGIYSTAYLFNGLFYSLIVLPWTGAYVPYILQKYAQNKDNIAAIEYSNRRFMWIAITSLTIIVLCIVFLAKPVIFMILPSSYHSAFTLIAPMVLGRIIYFGAQFNLCLLQFYKKTGIIFFSLLVPAGVNVLLNYLLIPLFGITATVVTSIISFSFYFVVTWYYNQKVFKEHAQEFRK